MDLVYLGNDLEVAVLQFVEHLLMVEPKAAVAKAEHEVKAGQLLLKVASQL